MLGLNHGRTPLSRHMLQESSSNETTGKGNANFEFSSVLASSRSEHNLKKSTISNLTRTSHIREELLQASVPRPTLGQLSRSQLTAEKNTAVANLNSSKSMLGLNHGRTPLSRHMLQESSSNETTGKGNANFEFASVLASPQSEQNMNKSTMSNST